MKDAHLRQNLDHSVTVESLPAIDDSRICVPENLVVLSQSGPFFSVDTQEEGRIVTSALTWTISAYDPDVIVHDERLGIHSNSNSSNTSSEEQERAIASSSSDASNMGDEVLEYSRKCKPFWSTRGRGQTVEEENATRNRVIFITKDVLAITGRDSSNNVSTLCARSGISLETISLTGASFDDGICKISDTMLALGSREGHLYFITHTHGTNLRVSERKILAHRGMIRSLEVHRDTILSTGADNIVRLWRTGPMEERASLYQANNVLSANICEQYIAVHSGTDEYDEIHLYRNADGYSRVKIFRTTFFSCLHILPNGHLVYFANDARPSGLVFLNIENNAIIAKLRLGIRFVNSISFLPNGRLVAVGFGGLQGVVADLPPNLRNLVSSEIASELSRPRRFCSLS